MQRFSMIGKTLGHYRILEKIGQGGMGEVFLAEDTSLRRKVALKFLPPALLQDPIARKRFIREARSAAALDHPYICHINEVGESDGQDFIVMEYVEGQSLKTRLDQGPLSLQDALQVGGEIAEALEKAHRADIVHRDLKPPNIMLTAEGHVKVMDFGLAKRVMSPEAGRTQEDTLTGLTEQGSTPGTLPYMSPEQLRGEEVDTRSDIFSFGIVLYEMLSGVHPFRRESQIATASAIQAEAPPLLARYAELVPELLEHMVRKMLAKKVDDRYQSVHEVLTNLHELSKPTAEALTAQRKEVVSQTGSLRWLAPLAGAVIVAVLGWYFLGRTSTSPPSGTRVDSKSVAVLPFSNLSDDPENEYFSDGLTEDVITQLSKIGELRVISRTSVMRYKNSPKSLREIGQELQVAAILEGSVRKSGDRIRITGKLIDAQTDEHLWAESYDRDLEDVFSIQSDVAEQIATALKAELNPSERALLEKIPTGNPAAYDLYLKGRSSYYRFNKQANESAIELFQQALKIDPDFALAYAGLGNAYGQRAQQYGFGEEWIARSIEMSQKAIELDPQLPEGLRALAGAYDGMGSSRKSLEYLLKALEIRPSYSAAANNTSQTYAQLGDYVNAMVWIQRSLQIDPTRPNTVFRVGLIYMWLDDYAKAEAWFDRSLAIDPGYVWARYSKAFSALLQNHPEQAYSEVVELNRLHPGFVPGIGLAGRILLVRSNLEEAEPLSRSAGQYYAFGWAHESVLDLGYILMKQGRQREARAVLATVETENLAKLKGGSDEPAILAEEALRYAILNEADASVGWLQKAVDGGWRKYRVQVLPHWDPVRSDPRFKQLMARVEADVQAQREQVDAREWGLPSD